MKLILTSILMAVALGANAQKLRKEFAIDSQPNTPVVLRLSEIKGLDFDVKSATIHLGFFTPPKETTGADGSVTLTYQDEDLLLAGQLDDIDGDERADELVFLSYGKEYTIDFYADEGGHTKFGATTSGNDERLVYADMMLDDKKGVHPFITALEAPGDSYLYNDMYHHGAAFENEYCGFRVYFDARQNIDIYGKKKRRLELADTHFYTTREQMAQGYGNDVLWAGNSVGCGSFKGWDGTAPTNIEPVKTRGQRIVAAGPLRTIVEVKDIGWNGLNMRQYYILYAGRRECEVRITFDRPLGDEVFCTGVQKIGSKPEGFVRSDGLAASWGSDYPEMGNKEQFPPEAVGLAVYVPKQFIKSTQESELNYLFTLGAKNQTSLHYYVLFCADKEEVGYHSAKEWFDALPALTATIDTKPKIVIK